MQVVRHSVKENILSDPSRVTDADCKEFLTVRGKGWVCEMENMIVGFAIADLERKNIWALFVRPDFEGKGIGKKLQALMMNWYFSQTNEKAWLGTSPGTRAEKFYLASGWSRAGTVNKGEIKFEMTSFQWSAINN